VHHLSGRELIIGRLLGMEFAISPVSFFEMNTTGAEVLFGHVAECAAVNKQTLFIDSCCGMVVIALLMANRAKSIVGLDIGMSAISDATRSARLN
jgi:tRNA/tmRNA/rRNA uracil-C5-methylase (TrmA/RlmC/RlmD family)